MTNFKRARLLFAILGMILCISFVSTGCSLIRHDVTPNPGYFPDKGEENTPKPEKPFFGIETLSDLPEEPQSASLAEKESDNQLLIASLEFKYTTAPDATIFKDNGSNAVSLDFDSDGVIETLWYMDRSGFLIFEGDELYNYIPYAFDPIRTSRWWFEEVYIIDVDKNDNYMELIVQFFDTVDKPQYHIISFDPNESNLDANRNLQWGQLNCFYNKTISFKEDKISYIMFSDFGIGWSYCCDFSLSYSDFNVSELLPDTPPESAAPDPMDIIEHTYVIFDEDLPITYHSLASTVSGKYNTSDAVLSKGSLCGIDYAMDTIKTIPIVSCVCKQFNWSTNDIDSVRNSIGKVLTVTRSPYFYSIDKSVEESVICLEVDMEAEKVLENGKTETVTLPLATLFTDIVKTDRSTYVELLGMDENVYRFKFEDFFARIEVEPDAVPPYELNYESQYGLINIGNYYVTVYLETTPN